MAVKNKSDRQNVTGKSYKELNDAYAFFNQKLFNNELPTCMIVLNRRSRTLGHFVNDIWMTKKEELKDEISLNPDYLIKRTVHETLSTLVHEMCHLWQANFGKPSRGGYHNKEWASKMMEVGLTPTDTGLVGGKKTGQSMTHLIHLAGPFDKACKTLIKKGFDLSMLPAPLDNDDETKTKKKKKSASKTRFSCPDCGMNAWGKPDLKVICGECEVRLISQLEN